MKLAHTCRISLVIALFTAAAQAGQIARTQNNSAAVFNNYSLIIPGMPSYGIAQGSIVQIYGTGLTLATGSPQNFPLPTTLNGTTLNITINGITTHPILYYVSATQIDAIIPSATPVGTGQITVTVQGAGTGAPAPITIVQSAFGMLSLNSVGNGPAAVYDVNSNYVGLTNAANPGDFITLWGTGLGPVTGDETMAQQAVDLTNIPIEVDIGGHRAVVQYHGRSQYPGLDQINVQVPQGVSGCHVSVVVRTGDIVSNFGTIPVATSGRVCSEPVAGLTDASIQTLLSQPTVTRGAIEVDSNVAPIGNAMDVNFARFTNSQYAVRQPGTPVSFNDCVAINYRNVNFGIGNPIQPVFLDAGASVNYTTPSGSGIGNGSIPNQDGDYSISGFMAPGSLKGTYTFNGYGGADIGPFSAQVDWPGGGGAFTFSTPNNSSAVTRSNGLTITWTQPGSTDPGEFIQISGFSFVPNYPFGAEFVCEVPLAAGRFTIPSSALLALPVQPSGTTSQAALEVDAVVSKGFTAPGADLGIIRFVFGIAEQFYYQ